MFKELFEFNVDMNCKKKFLEEKGFFMSADSNLWYYWKSSMSLVLSLRVTLKYMIDNLGDNIFEYNSISAISIGNHMMALYDLSNLADKHVKKLGEIMFFMKASMDEIDKEDICYTGQEYNEVFAWYIWNHNNEQIISEFKSVIRFIDFDVKYLYNVFFKKTSIENNDIRISRTGVYI